MTTMIRPTDESVHTPNLRIHTPAPEPIGSVNLFVRITLANSHDVELYTLRKISYGYKLTEYSATDEPPSHTLTLDWDGEIECSCGQPGRCHHSAALAALAKAGHLDFGNPPPEPDWDEMAKEAHEFELYCKGIRLF